MQLRNAANAVELAPDLPRETAATAKGSRGSKAGAGFECGTRFGIRTETAAASVPPAPEVFHRRHQLDAFPVGALTPCDFRQLVNAALDAEDFVDVDLEAEDLVVVVVLGRRRCDGARFRRLPAARPPRRCRGCHRLRCGTSDRREAELTVSFAWLQV